MAGKQKSGERKWLYSDTGDQRGNLWSKVSMGPDFSAFNEANPVELTKGSLFEDIMKVDNYTNMGENMRIGDVHNEVIDLIVMAANYHKTIDRPFGTDTQEIKIRQSLEYTLPELLKNDGEIAKLFFDDTDKFFLNEKTTSTGGEINLDIDEVDTALKKLKDTGGKAYDNGVLKIINLIYNKEPDGITVTIGADIKKASLKHIKEKLHFAAGEPTSEIVSELDFQNAMKQRVQDFVDIVCKDLLNAIKKSTSKKTHNFGGPDELKNHMIKTVKISNLQSNLDGLASDLGAMIKSKYGEGPRKNLSTPESQELYKNIFNEWNSLNEYDKQFYHKFLMAIKTDPVTRNESNILDLSAMISESPSKFIRFNLKKEGGVLIFKNSLPRFPISLFPRIHYTNLAGNITSIDTDGANDTLLRDIYNAIYYGGEKTDEIEVKSGTLTFKVINSYSKAKNLLQVSGNRFHILVDKLVQKRLYKLTKAKFAKVEPIYDTVTRDYLDLISEQKFRRGVDGHFYVNTDNGEVRLDLDNAETQRMLSYNNSCYGTGIIGDKTQCSSYMFECLLADGDESLERCLNNFKKEDYFPKASTEINKMHPIIALRTLQRFGFRTHTVHDDIAGTSLRKVQTVDQWLGKFMVKHFKKEKLQDIIKGNDRLLAYLDLISQFVNANPGILNKGYGGSSQEAEGVYKRSSLAEALDIPLRKEPSSANKAMYDIGLMKGHLRSGYLGSLVRARKDPFFSLLGNSLYSPFGSNLTGVGNVVLPMSGGSGTEWLLRKLNNNTSGSPVVGAKLIKEIFMVTYRDMEKRNKHLSQEDMNKIKVRLDNLIKNEERTLRTIFFMQEYNKLLDAFKNYETVTLSENQLQGLVDRHKKLSTSHMGQEEYLLKVLEKLQQIITDDNDIDGSYNRINLN